MKLSYIDIRSMEESNTLLRLIGKCECDVRFVRSFVIEGELIERYMIDPCGRSCRLTSRFAQNTKGIEDHEVMIASFFSGSDIVPTHPDFHPEVH